MKEGPSAYQPLNRYREVIQSVCQKMGHGMAQYCALATPEAPVAEVNSIQDYDLYCHYVAGLVGEGLSGLFSASGKERSFIKDQLTLSNHMGLLLQKTNILRDFREDVDEGRGFWPRAIWGKYGFDKMGDLRDESREKEALWALSEMTLDALRHAAPALDYLSLLKCQSVFNFVAIPAVMALATLERCFMNPDVLKKNVKIRKGEAIKVSTYVSMREKDSDFLFYPKLMNLAVNPRDVAYCFVRYAKKIHAKVSVHDPNFVKLSIACGKVSLNLSPLSSLSLILVPGSRLNSGLNTTTRHSLLSAPVPAEALRPPSTWTAETLEQGCILKSWSKKRSKPLRGERTKFSTTCDPRVFSNRNSTPRARKSRSPRPKRRLSKRKTQTKVYLSK